MLANCVGGPYMQPNYILTIITVLLYKYSVNDRLEQEKLNKWIKPIFVQEC